MDDRTTQEAIEKAREAAYRNENWKMTSDPYENGWDRGFEVGFTAGLAHAHTWVKLETDDDLPPMTDGNNLYLFHSAQGQEWTVIKWTTDQNTKVRREYLAKRYDRYLPVPAYRKEKP